MSEPRDDDAPTGPFRVEVTDGGCEHCSAGKTWGVVYPDGTLSGSFYESEEDAEDACFMFNAGYALGRDENKSWHSETGWVIVTEGAGRLVYFSGSLLIPNDDPLRAVRFARQEDAERIRAALVAGELVASHMDAEERARRSVVTNWLNSRVEEHEWCGPSEQSKPCGDGCRGCAYCRQESSAPPETPPPTCTEREKR